MASFVFLLQNKDASQDICTMINANQGPLDIVISTAFLNFVHLSNNKLMTALRDGILVLSFDKPADINLFIDDSIITEKCKHRYNKLRLF